MVTTYLLRGGFGVVVSPPFVVERKAFTAILGIVLLGRFRSDGFFFFFLNLV